MPSEIAIFTLAFLLWAVVHSVTASLSFKTNVRRWVGERLYAGLYRLSYNLLALLTFVPLWLLARALPDGVIWTVLPPAAYLLRLVQVVGLLGVVVSIWQTRLLEFAGLRQAIDLAKGEKEYHRANRLVTGGLYRLVRHPLYFFSLLALWANPTMTVQLLAFNLLATLYFWIGSVFEERKLVAAFGEEYRRYQDSVPRLLPIRWPLLGQRRVYE